MQTAAMRFHRAIACLLLALAWTASSLADQPRFVDACTLIGSDDSARWSEQELWAWSAICKGEIADLRHPPLVSQAQPLSPDLSAKFIKMLLLQEPWRSATPSQGVRIIGAHFRETIDLEAAAIAHHLSFTDAKFDAALVLDGAQLSGGLSLDGSQLRCLTLTNAKIAGDLSMVGTHVMQSPVAMDGLGVAGALTMKHAQLPTVYLRSAKISGSASLDAARAADIDMDGISIGGRLTLQDADNQHSQVQWLRLGGGKIGGLLRLDAAELGYRDPPYHSLDAPGLQVGGDLTMVFTTFADASFKNAKIEGDLSLAGAKQLSGSQPKVDLTGATIRGAFILGTQWYGSVRWQPGAYLILRNTTVRDVEDGKGDCALPDIKHHPDIVCSPMPWPDKLDLEDFHYQRFGSSDLYSVSGMKGRSLDWWLDWLGREQQFSLQPYEKLASALRAYGLSDTANEILVAEHQLERAKVSWNSKAWMTALWLFIGYGYHPFWVLRWVLILVVAGAVVLRISGQGKENNMPYGITFSVDMLLPIIRLRESNYKIELKGFARYYFYVHKVMGYVIVAFLGAGLSGLAK